MILILLTLVHVLVCVFLIVVVLLQSGKAADLAGAFGGMGSQTAFGPRGSATLLTKATTVSAIVFMLTSLSLSILATRDTGAGGTVLEGARPAAPVQQQQPANPAVPGQVPMDVDTGGQKQTIQVPTIPPPSQQPPADKK